MYYKLVASRRSGMVDIECVVRLTKEVRQEQIWKMHSASKERGTDRDG